MAILAVNAWVDGKGYGPGFGNAADVPADVAAKITDPAAWEDGQVPKPAKRRAKPAVAEPEPAVIDEGNAEPDPFDDLTD